MTAVTDRVAREVAALEDRRRRPRPAPERSLEQRMTALARANRIREDRAQLKRDLKARRASVYDVLRDRHADTVASMKLQDLLVAMPKCGRVKANKVLQLARCSPSKTLGGLTDRQARELELVLQTFPALRR